MPSDIAKRVAIEVFYKVKGAVFMGGLPLYHEVPPYVRAEVDSIATIIDEALAKEREAVSNRPKIVCLCGSGRFKEAFDNAEFDETLKGHIVLTIGCNTKDIARTPNLEHHKPMLDELHKRKIDLADEVLVLNVGGYIGESTRGEVCYALDHKKPIVWLEPDHAEGNLRTALDKVKEVGR